MSQFESIEFSVSEHGQCLHALALDQQYKQLLFQSVLNDLHELGWTNQLAPTEYSMFFSLIYDYFSMTKHNPSSFVGSPAMQTLGIFWEHLGNHNLYLFFTLIHYLITRFHQKLSLQQLSLPSTHHSQKSTVTTDVSWLTNLHQCIQSPFSSFFSSTISLSKPSSMSFIPSLSMNSLLSQLISHPKQTFSKISQEYIQQNQLTLLHFCKLYLFLEQTFQLIYALAYLSNNQSLLTQGKPSLGLFLTGYQMKSTITPSSCLNSTQLQSQYSQLYWKLLTDVIYAIKTTIHEPTIKYYMYFYITKYIQFIKPLKQQLLQIISTNTFSSENEPNNEKSEKSPACSSSDAKINQINTSIKKQSKVICCVCHQDPPYQPVQSICCQHIYCYLCFYQLISSSNDETLTIDFTKESDYTHTCHECYQTLDLKSIQPLII